MMNDTQLQELLRGLPREQASRDFTDRVLERTARPRVHYRQPLFAALALVLVAAVTTSVEMARASQEKERLRLERQEIAEELRQLEQLSQTYEPMIVVSAPGSDVELVLDLRKPGSGQPVQTASYTQVF